MKRVLYKKNVKNWRITVEEGSMRVEAFIYFYYFICKRTCMCNDM